MRTFKLASISLQAEGVRLRHQLRRRLIQAGLLLVAYIVFLAALVCGHVSVYMLLADHLSSAAAAGILAGGDLLIFFIVGWIALSWGPGRQEREAAALSGLARGQIRQSLQWTNLLGSLLDLLSRETK